MKIKAIYENNVLKPIGDLNLPNRALVSITIHESFSDLLDELGEPEAREDIDAVLKETRTRRYYDLFEYPDACIGDGHETDLT